MEASHHNKKIYITCLHLLHGGVENVISNLANAFIERGMQVTILCTYHLGTPAYALHPDVQIEYLTSLHPNREAFRLAFKERHFLQMIREGIYAVKVLYQKKATMKRAIQSIKTGTIISTRHEHSLLLSKYGNSAVKKIAQLHHDHHFNKRLIYDFCHRYHNIDYFALLTEQHTKEISALMGKYNTHTKCLTIPNFIHLPLVVECPVPQNQVIAVGRLEKEKGFDRLLQIWSLAVRDVPNWKLKIIGDGTQRVLLEDMIKRMSLESSVTLMGAMSNENTIKEMWQSQLYAMTSYTEAFPLVLAEAQSCGLPVIAFDVRVGPKAMIADGIDGFLIKDNDLQAFAAKMICLANDVDLRKKYGKAALESSTKYMQDQVIDQWMQIL